MIASDLHGRRPAAGGGGSSDRTPILVVLAALGVVLVALRLWPRRRVQASRS
jgi:hypothetical protein